MVCTILTDRPSRPGQPAVTTITRRSAVLSWYGCSYDGGSTVTGYRIEQQQVQAGTLSTDDQHWQLVTDSCQVYSISISICIIIIIIIIIIIDVVDVTSAKKTCSCVSLLVVYFDDKTFSLSRSFTLVVLSSCYYRRRLCWSASLSVRLSINVTQNE